MILTASVRRTYYCRHLNGWAVDVDFEIPDRIKDGYGINESIIEQAHADGVEVILTCDNGISAFHQVELAKKYGMTVVITDHHEVPLDGEKEKIPPADAVIDPKQADCPYPFPEICGAVVAYKLVQVLYARRGVPQMEWLDLLEFAAIATVGDVMKLQDENRILVKYGLKKMAQTKNLGLRRLAEKIILIWGDHSIPYRICHWTVPECGRTIKNGKGSAGASAGAE